MAESRFVPFEQAFPAAFAEAVTGLLEGTGLDELCRRLCVSVSRRLAPTTIGVTRAMPHGDVVVAAPDGPVGVRRAISGTDGSRWGDVTSSPPGADTGDLDAIAGFLSWLVDRNESRRRHVATIDRERQLIAGQLHDDSIQAMTAISLHLQRLARSSGTDRALVDVLLRLTNDAIERLRHMMFALHPPSLAADGLVVTLEDYLDAFIAPTGLRTNVSGDRGQRTTDATEALAFRLARGAIHNVWKHAQATAVDVTVEVSDAGARIVVTDDGMGFDTSSIPDVEVGHAGIPYSRDLAAEVGGTYDVRSARGAGTTVEIVLPPW